MSSEPTIAAKEDSWGSKNKAQMQIATKEKGFFQKIPVQVCVLGGIGITLALIAGIFYAISYLKKKKSIMTSAMNNNLTERDINNMAEKVKTGIHKAKANISHQINNISEDDDEFTHSGFDEEDYLPELTEDVHDDVTDIPSELPSAEQMAANWGLSDDEMATTKKEEDD